MLLTLAVVACGTQEQREPAAQLVPQLSDLPAGFNLDPAESFPVPTSKILAEPFSGSSSAIIRRERLSGYQAAFTNPLGHPIECSAAIYRSSASARKVYRLRTRSVNAFVVEVLGVARIGEETQAARFDFGAAQYLGVAWRYRNILSGCVAGGSSPKAEILVVARAQQRRIAQTGIAGR